MAYDDPQAAADLEEWRRRITNRPGVNPSRVGQTTFTEDVNSLKNAAANWWQGVKEGRWATPYADTPATDIDQRLHQAARVVEAARPTLGTDWDVAGAKGDVAAGRYGDAVMKLGHGMASVGADVMDFIEPGSGTALSTIAAPFAIAAKRGRKPAKTIDEIKAAADRAEAQAQTAVTPAGDVVPQTPKKREAVGAVSLRDLPMDEATAIAQTERHLQPAPPAKPGAKQGAYAGGPVDVQSREDLIEMRRRFDEDVKKGASGSDWYWRTQEWIKEMAGDDPARQSELARNLALFSAQADPDGNLGFAIAARNAAAQGMPAAKVRTGQQARTYNDAFFGVGHNSGDSLDPLAYDPERISQNIKLGPKTGIFGGHMDPTVSNPVTGTNDIWHARAFGYTNPKTGKPWSAALGDAQHAFMDYETVLAVDRANKEAWGGRTNWQPGEVQAAPWVEGKAQGLMKKRKNMSYEQALAEAAKTYPDYAPKYTAFGTYEHVPGKKSMHLPEIAQGDDEVRAAYARNPMLSWRDPKTGRDIIYDAQGGYVGRTRDTQGVYEGEVNPGSASPNLVMFEPGAKPGRKELDMPSTQALTGGEAFRAYVNAQEAGAGSIPIKGQLASRTNSYAFDQPAGSVTPQRARELNQLAQQYGHHGIIHYGTDPLTNTDKVIASNFSYPPEPGSPPEKFAEYNAEMKRIQNNKNVRAFEQALGSPVQRAERQGVYIDYTDKWQDPKTGQARIGSDEATKHMLSQITEHQERFFSSPQVREVVQRQWEVDEGLKAQGHQVREDIQMARKLIATGGIPALKDALGKGLLPAAAAAAVLSQVPGGAGGGDQPSDGELRS